MRLHRRRTATKQSWTPIPCHSSTLLAPKYRQGRLGFAFHFACDFRGHVHGLLSILPKQTGLTHDSLLTGDTLLASPKLCSMGVMEPVNCLKMLTQPLRVTPPNN
jgi:hypothetical protein